MQVQSTTPTTPAASLPTHRIGLGRYLVTSDTSPIVHRVELLGTARATCTCVHGHFAGEHSVCKHSLSARATSALLAEQDRLDRLAVDVFFGGLDWDVMEGAGEFGPRVDPEGDLSYIESARR